jgi:hypothetical protein
MTTRAAARELHLVSTQPSRGDHRNRCEQQQSQGVLLTRPLRLPTLNMAASPHWSSRVWHRQGLVRIPVGALRAISSDWLGHLVIVSGGMRVLQGRSKGYLFG